MQDDAWKAASAAVRMPFQAVGCVQEGAFAAAFQAFFDIAVIFHEGQKKLIGLCLRNACKRSACASSVFPSMAYAAAVCILQMQRHQGIL